MLVSFSLHLDGGSGSYSSDEALLSASIMLTSRTFVCVTVGVAACVAGWLAVYAVMFAWRLFDAAFGVATADFIKAGVLSSVRSAGAGTCWLRSSSFAALFAFCFAMISWLTRVVPCSCPVFRAISSLVLPLNIQFFGWSEHCQSKTVCPSLWHAGHLIVFFGQLCRE